MPPTRDAAPDADRVQLSEAARILGVSADTVRRWGDRGLLTVWRRGPGRIREYSRAEVQRLYEENNTPVTVQEPAVVTPDASGAA